MQWTDGTAYFSRALSYARNMLMKSTTGVCLIKNFRRRHKRTNLFGLFITNEEKDVETNKLDRLSLPVQVGSLP